MADALGLSATLENYLKAMAQLTAEKGLARVRDIADALAVHKSTVTAALRSLSERGLVDYAPYEVATLTPEGQLAADSVLERHEIIREFLVEVLFLDEGMAETSACRMEHDLDKEVLDRLQLFAEFMKQCPHCGEGRLHAFRTYCMGQGRLKGDRPPSER